MILSNVVNVKISNNQIKYYKEKGYDIIGGNEIKEIKVSDLPPNSGQKIRVECDFCGTQKLLSLNRYMINTKNKTLMYACCQKCMQDKVKNTCLEKYEYFDSKYEVSRDKLQLWEVDSAIFFDLEVAKKKLAKKIHKILEG